MIVGGEGAMHAEQGGKGIWKLSVLSAQFCCEPKTTLKKKSIFVYI